MTHAEAGKVSDFAKNLFPVTSQERIDSLGVVLATFPDPTFAQQVLVEHSHESEKLAIPWVKEKLTTELRKRVLANESKACISTVREWRSEGDKRDDLLNSLTHEDLKDLQADVVKYRTKLPPTDKHYLSEDGASVIMRQDPKRHDGLRKMIHELLTTPARVAAGAFEGAI